MPGIRGYTKCSTCKFNTAVTLYIQKRENHTRRFVKFGIFCGYCGHGIQFGKEAKKLTNKVMKIKYRLAPKIRTTGAAV